MSALVSEAQPAVEGVDQDVAPTEVEEAPPAPPSLDERLNWSPEQGELDPELQSVPLDEVRTYREQVAEQARQAAREEFEAERARERAEMEVREREQAATQADIRFAEDLDSRLTSADETVKQNALNELAENRTQYARGLQAREAREQQVQRETVLAQHYTPMVDGLRAAGHQGLIDSFRQRMEQHGQNALLVALEYGKEIGRNEGQVTGAEEAERRQRIEANSNGAPTMAAASPAPDSSARFANREWVTQQKQNDPGWPLKDSGHTDENGRKLSNTQMVLRAEAQRLRAQR